MSEEIFKMIFNQQLMQSILSIAVAILLHSIMNRFLKRTTKNLLQKGNKKQVTIIGLFRNFLKYFMGIVVLIIILGTYGVNTSALITSIGALGLIIGLALQDLIKDFIAGIFIIFDNQYNIGEIITINGFKGEVVSLGLKSTKIKSTNGEILIISNGKIIQVINHSIENSLAVVDIEVPYQVDVDKVLLTLNKLSTKISKNNDVLLKEIKVLGIIDLTSSGIKIRLTAETLPNKHYEIERQIRKEIKTSFDEENIEFSNKNMVVYNGKKL